MTTEGATLLAVHCETLAERGDPATADLLEYFDPDLVYVTRDGFDPRIASRLRRAFDGPVVRAVDPTRDGPQVVTAAGVRFLFVDTPDALGADAGDAPRTDIDYVVCDGLETRTDAVSLEVDLAGRAAIADYRLRARSGDTGPTFLTGALEAGYDYVWTAMADGTRVRLPIRGCGPRRRPGADELPCLTCAPDGSIAVTSVPADRFGLAALEGVGPETADRLRAAGFDDRAAVADASLEALRSVRGIGTATAETIRGSARAIAEGRVVRRTDAPVPPVDGSLLFVDIETDGLHPTVIPLIGVYDPGRDAYVDFVDEEPTRNDAGRATRAFVDWLAAEYDRPALVAWNGREFDYVHLERFVTAHAPAYHDYWREHVSRYDPYDWAVRQDNAILPGRTNRLADIAAALGCERGPDAAAMDGRTFATRVRRLLERSDGEDECEREMPTDDAVPAGVDWERARRYCEADVREVAAVYDALASAPEPTGTTAEPSDEQPTTQTGLTDF
ncbi:ribonuclease H-like domain-containing protein [Halobiforma nitratireducens]|uniref:Helix-hairpin-helix motif protein n=1 Tax=Halobiforma nitratireducens JCM 10879 TaxID=1227454 RepID=M0L782_9EURY|nr:ribonuclease H-like domain-containing protein [Halobiforma nitratireducens]EMA29406.1 helix-hairpin-helix motif protein [Halobiforma nitratireducens JCM 10879]